MEEIAVVGIGCNFPGGEGLTNFWKVLVDGRNCTVEIPKERFDFSFWYDPDESKNAKSKTSKAALIDGFNDFDSKFFGITDAEADYMDPQHKLLLQCSYRVLEDAGIPMEKASGTRTGVYIGVMNRDYEIFLSHGSTCNHYYATGTSTSLAANRISYAFNLTGPSMVLDTACSSSLVAIHSACQAINQGDCDMALCGGVSCILEPKIFVALSKANMISPDGTSKPFSSRADGYGRGEGCGVVLLKPLKQALSDCDHIWGIISKTGVNQDGCSVTPITKPSMDQQEKLLHRIYSTESDLTSVQYIEAHGTGTPVGDPIEAGSISKVIAKARPPGSETLIIGSVKGNIGHTESASGMAGLIKVLLMMKHEIIVPSVFYSEDSASIDAKKLNIKIPTRAEKWSGSGGAARVAGINNFGFGGTNAHVIVKQHEQPRPLSIEGKRTPQHFVLSAASEKSLTMMIADTAEQLGKTTADLPTLAYTSACRRSHVKHKYRKVFISSTLADLKNQLNLAPTKKFTPSKPDTKVVFVFCGNGVTYRGMCRRLLKKEPVFREKVREINTLFQRFTTCCIVKMLEKDSENESDLSKPDVVQPLLFAVQVAIASLLKHWGVKPVAVLGHSVGEVAAAHCSGLLSLDDAVKVIYYRSVLQNKVTGGKMLVVSHMAVSEVLNLLPLYSGKVCLAAHNSPTSCTLSGDAESILALYKTLSNSANSKTLFLHILDVPAAYHSHMMDPILPEVESSIGTLKENEMIAELYSTVSGKLASNRDFCTGTYWSKNVREPVKFEKALTAAAKDKKNAVFVEIGPRQALYRNILETLGTDTVVLSSAQLEKDHETLCTTFAKLFELGLNVNWDQFYGCMQMMPTAVPRYQFDRNKKPLSISYASEGIASDHAVLKQTGKGDEFSCDLSSTRFSYLSDHKNNGVPIIPGALHAEMALAAYMINAKPKVPLNTLDLSITFLSPFLLTPNHPELNVKLEADEQKTYFKIHSNNTVFASGSIEHKTVQMLDQQNISLECVTKRCTSVIKSDELYRKLDKGGFQYDGVFRNTGDVFCGVEFREAYSFVTIPDELLCQLHDFCIHPVILDYLLQLTLVTSLQGNAVRPGIPSAIGSLIVLEPFQKEMVIYLKATDLADDHFMVCGCLTDRDGRVLVEVRDIVVKYVGRASNVIEKYFFHNEMSVMSEDFQPNISVNALVFSDNSGISLKLKPHLSNSSIYISSEYAGTLLKHGLQELLSKFKISDLQKTFTDVLFMWGDLDISTQTVDDVLANVTNCCELFRQVVLELRKQNFSNSVRVVTFQSSETTVDHISTGFVLSGMTRACAAEISEFTSQLIDIGSVTKDDMRALSQVLTSYPCKKYPELVVKDGQIFQPQMVHTAMRALDVEKRDQCSQVQCFTLQTADAYKMTSLSTIPSNEDVGHLPEKNVEVQLSKICVHSSDYYPVSVSEQKFGQTMYWNKHTNQNHKLLALDVSGTVTAIGKGVRKLKVGDHIAACYPAAAASKVVLPEDVCYKTKKLPCFRDLPCVSYLVVVWRIVHFALPKLKLNGKLAILCSFPDSGLLKALTLIVKRFGWNAFVATELSDLVQDLNNFDALVLLPPFDQSKIAKACTIPGVKNIVLVCKETSSCSFTKHLLREVSDNAYIQTIETSSLLSKGSMNAHGPVFYRWLKTLHLDKNSLTLPSITFQRFSTGSIDLLALDEPESYFSVRTMPVVVLNESKGKHAVSDIPLLPSLNRLFYQNCVYIVTGGLTGLGFETVKFIAERGGGCIVIFSRRKPSTEMQQEIDAVKRQYGAVIASLQCDISVTKQVKNAIITIEECFPSCQIKGVFHSAVVLHDTLLGNLDKSLFEKVLKPKVNGVMNLHQATSHCNLDYFVCFSSTASALGSPYQTNYAAANSFLDTFCHYRRRLGLAAQSINWGALNLGLLLNKDHVQKFLAAQGMMVMERDDIIESLEECLLLSKPQQVISKFDYANMFHFGFSQNSTLSIRLEWVVKEAVQLSKISASPSANKASHASPIDLVRTVLSESLGVEYEELNDDTALSALGVDSMLGVTLQNLIFQGTDVNIPLVKILDPSCTVASLASILMEDPKDRNLNTKL